MAKKEKRSRTTILTPEKIISVMSKAGKPLYQHEIAKEIDIDRKNKGLLRMMLDDLVDEGKIVHIKGDRFGVAQLMQLVTGKISIHPDGFGFLEPEKEDGKKQEDIFIPPKGLKGAMHKDRVVVRVEKSRGKRQEGSVIRILERTIERLVGTFHTHKSYSYVVPEDERLAFDVFIPNGFTLDAKHGDAVWAEITEYPEESRNPEGRIVEVLGDPLDLGVQTQIVIRKHDLSHQFSAATMDELEKFPDEISEDDITNRTDLRNLSFVTIDGENARDFDDAVYVKKTRNGYILFVSIADVSHYVVRDNPIDKDALARSTSVYFPNAVVPMLPEKLSNNLCSLVPNKDRLTMTAEIWYDKEANIRKTRFYSSVIRSKKRFTYNEVFKLMQKKTSRGLEGDDKFFFRNVKDMEELSDLIGIKRTQRGSIDFDLPEPEIIIGLSGNMEDIVKRERNKAHKLIEEFMIAANEAVATFLSGKEIPALYRVHDTPDTQKVLDFIRFAQTLGFNVRIEDEVTPAWCQQVLKMVVNLPQEYIINSILLRSMQQAVYSPDNIGHFGLASSFYLHFTSPIRRYPDLVTHRVLRGFIETKKKVYQHEELKKIGESASSLERKAMEAEREMVERLKVRFMEDKVGAEFDGVISGVASFGFFVELKDVFVEGAVRLVDLADDYYVYDSENYRLFGQNTKKIFQIGMPVRVKLKGVNIKRRHINFEVAQSI